MLVEPIKGQFVRAARRRQARTERIERFVMSGAILRYALADYNRTFRAMVAGPAAGDAKRFRARMVVKINESHSSMRDALALFWLYGPESLAEDARSVMDAAREVTTQLKEPDAGECTQIELPEPLRRAAKDFNDSLAEFSAKASRHIG